jgi:hypothetical protein
MLNNILDFIGKIAILIFFLATIILSIYGVIYLGILLLKILARWM